jgi:hypothetical protein
MTAVVRHGRLAVVSQTVPSEAHQARCACGWETAWLPLLYRAEGDLELHVAQSALTELEAAMPIGETKYRRRLDAAAVQRAQRSVADIQRMHANEQLQQRWMQLGGWALVVGLFALAALLHYSDRIATWLR